MKLETKANLQLGATLVESVAAVAILAIAAAGLSKFAGEFAFRIIGASYKGTESATPKCSDSLRFDAAAMSDTFCIPNAVSMICSKPIRFL